MKIKTKLLVFIGGSLILLMSTGFTILIANTSIKITKSLNEQLDNQTKSITRQVSQLISTSASSYLMAVGDKSNTAINAYYDLYQKDILTMNQALDTALKAQDEFKFLKTGYIFVTDKDGFLISHPNKDKIGSRASIADWLNNLKEDEKSTYRYTYEGRNKMLFRVYNKKFNINICASAYISEFINAIDKDQLNTSMNNLKVGTTGYPMLMTKTGVVLTHPDSSIRNRNILSMKDADGKQIFRQIVKQGEGNFTYRWKDKDGTINEKFMHYLTEPNSELIVCSTGYVQDFYETVGEIKNFMLIMGIVIILILGVVIYVISLSVSKPIILFTNKLIEISEGNGDLTKRISLKTGGELANMVKFFNNFLNTMQSIITEIKLSANLTNEIKDEISYGVDETSAALYEISTNIDGINNQTKGLNDNIEHTAESIEKINENIYGLNNSVENQSTMLQTSTAAITQMISSIDNVSKISTTKQESALDLISRAREGAEVIDKTENAVKEVSNQLIKIKEIAIIISGVASKTNLLAMNAAIEAAHAGNAGKGFAVVADEIRKLAETSSSNTVKITETLKDVEASILQAESLSMDTRESFNLVSREINGIVGALGEIDTSTNELQIGGKDILESITGLEEASTVVKERSIAIQKESEGVNNSMNNTKQITLDVVNAIDEIGQGTKGISDSMERVSSTSLKLKDTGDMLNNNVNRFKT